MITHHRSGPPFRPGRLARGSHGLDECGGVISTSTSCTPFDIKCSIISTDVTTCDCSRNTLISVAWRGLQPCQTQQRCSNGRQECVAKLAKLMHLDCVMPAFCIHRCVPDWCSKRRTRHACGDLVRGFAVWFRSASSRVGAGRTTGLDGSTCTKYRCTASQHNVAVLRSAIFGVLTHLPQAMTFW